MYRVQLWRFCRIGVGTKWRFDIVEDDVNERYPLRPIDVADLIYWINGCWEEKTWLSSQHCTFMVIEIDMAKLSLANWHRVKTLIEEYRTSYWEVV